MKRYSYIFAVLIILQFCYCSENRYKRIGKIDLSSSLNITKIIPNLQLPSSGNPIAPYKDNIFFILDQDNQRILKVDHYGKQLLEIGGEGGGNENISRPMGVFLRDNILYILDNYGQYVKKFSPDGEFKDAFAIANAGITWGIQVDDGYVYVSPIFKHTPEYKNFKLISIYTKEGELVKTLGDPLGTVDYRGYTQFNQIFFSVKDKRVYIAFKYSPLIKVYGIDGSQIQEIDLTQKKIQEINQAVQSAANQAVDTPGTFSGQRARKFIYCDGFAIDSNHHFYYSIGRTILHFDHSFNLLEKIRLVKNELRCNGVAQLYADEAGNRLGLGICNRKIHIYSF